MRIKGARLAAEQLRAARDVHSRRLASQSFIFTLKLSQRRGQLTHRSSEDIKLHEEHTHTRTRHWHTMHSTWKEELKCTYFSLLFYLHALYTASPSATREPFNALKDMLKEYKSKFKMKGM
jgi:hypothetical protein